MREITTHRAGDGPNDNLLVEHGEDTPEKYYLHQRVNNVWDRRPGMDVKFCTPADPNGFTPEALVAIVLDRLAQLKSQRSDAPNKDEVARRRAIAITHLETALLFLKENNRA